MSASKGLCLITRAQPGADVSAASLCDLGFDAYAVPAAIITPTGVDVEIDGVQALLMTSAAAARTTKATPQVRALPLYAVGDATAQAAIAAGFDTVVSAGGDGAALAVLAADRMKPGDGALLHLRGQEVAGDVTGMLSACGFTTRLLEVYRTDDHPEFQNKVLGFLQQRAGHILFHSPAGARRFAAAIEDQKIILKGWNAFGLSQACVLPLVDSGFDACIAAQRPEEDALIEAVFAHLPHSRS
jgi:uroporphyrinogen-III synthase